MQEVFVLSAVRTPIGKYGGGLASVPPVTWPPTAQPGLRNFFDLLRAGIDSTLLALGRSSVHDLSADDIIVPADFARGLSK